MENQAIIAIAAPEIKVADVNFNTDNAIAAIKRAAGDNAALIIFPQKILTGCTCGDLFYLGSFKKALAKSRQRLIDFAQSNGIAVALGAQVICGTLPKTINPHGFSLPYQIGQTQQLGNKLIKASAKSDKLEVLCGASYGESTADGVFAGHKIVAKNGKIIFESNDFFGDNSYVVFNGDSCVFGNASNSALPELDEQLTALSAGIYRRMKFTGINKLILGVSGGLDSTMALISCAAAIAKLGLPSQNLVCVTMPCFGTTSRTKNNALRLTRLYGASVKEIDISAQVTTHLQSIGHDFSPDITLENAQARMRTMVLFNLANHLGGLVVGTGDLSESALGFCTYGGDHISMYNVNCGVTKTHMRALVLYEAVRRGAEIKMVLGEVLSTPISPELIPLENGEQQQKTEDIIGAYEVHDFYLDVLIGNRLTIKDAFIAACERFGAKYTKQNLKKWLKLFAIKFFANQFKRSCSPDGCGISRVSLSPRTGFYMPSDSSVNVWLKEIEELK